jgi:hypothetical protein
MRRARRRLIVSAKEVMTVTFSRKDSAATALTALVVLAFLSTHEGWGVPLIGGSHRWAAGAILLLGMLTCTLGSPGKGTATKVSAVLGTLALALAVAALVTGSLTPLSLLVVDIVALWLVATFAHVRHEPRTPIVA